MKTTSKLHAAKILRESEERYRNLANSLPEIIFEADLSGKVLFGNRRGFEITGYNEADFRQGIDIFNLIATQDRGRAIEHFKKTLDNQPSTDNEFTVITKDGRTFPAIIISSLIVVNKHTIGVRGIVIDITERKKMEDALRKSQNKYRDLIETANDFIWEIDPQGRYTYCSPQIEKLWGLKPADMVGKTPFDLMPSGDKEKALAAFMLAINSPRPISGMQTTSYDNEGRLIFLEINGVPFFNDKGKFCGFRGITRDITARKKTEIALRESEERLRIYLESTPAAVFVANPDGRYVYVNKGASNLLGYSKNELLNMRIPDVLCNDSLAQGLEKFREVKETGKSRTDICLKRKNGSAVYVILTATKLPNGNLIANCENITERRRLEKILHAKERLAAIGQTAGMVGHDIRNPLQAMVSDLYLLKSDLASMPTCETCANQSNCSGLTAKQGISESINSIEDNIGYINKIVADLQDYARPLKPEIVEIPNLCEVIAKYVNSIIIPSNIMVLQNCSINLPTVKLDLTFLKRILTNLATNASQAMPNGGELTINTYSKADKIIIEVKDTGVGISDEVKPKLFQPMTSTKAKGQGLGLSVVKRLVEAQNGSISFESEAGKGTKFKIELPTNQ